VLVIAAIGTVLGGLAGYITLYRTVKGPPDSVFQQSAAQPAEPLSILVLPLTDQTGDPSKAHIADGLTTAITADLSRIQDALIVPPLVAVSLQKQGLTLSQLSQQARVRYVLQGGVAANGDAIRLTVQLSDARLGVQLWSDVIEARGTDLFALQDKLTTRVRTSVGPQMILRAAREAEQRKEKPKVSDLLLRLQASALKPQSLDNVRAQEVLARQIVDIEPEHARGLAWLSGALRLQVQNYGQPPRDEAAQLDRLRQAAALAERALAVDPTLVSPHASISEYAFRSGDYDKAQRVLKQAIELNPNSRNLHNELGFLLFRLGDYSAAKPHFLRAIEIPAYTPSAEAFVNLSGVLLYLGDLDGAIAYSDRAVQANPLRPFYRVNAILAYALKGDVARARSAAQDLLRLSPEYVYRAGVTPLNPEEGRRIFEEKLIPAAKLAGLPVDPELVPR
jgi:adenylate cyclase